jgi:hypothetical protein
MSSADYGRFDELAEEFKGLAAAGLAGPENSCPVPVAGIPPK